jgi:hypothetical protein
MTDLESRALTWYWTLIDQGLGEARAASHVISRYGLRYSRLRFLIDLQLTGYVDDLYDDEPEGLDEGLPSV